ncbi:MAG: sugar ABC transporter permease [Chloroflexi bacterium]|jgi:putative multiple sugar transport system permease protein|nr:sugar ABC transporter permease [Chloroflexota bacterium]BCY19574.1 ABC transporter permease [Leptolinea sp. HRD-7]
MSFGANLKKVFSQNIREYGMYIALFVIMAIFAVTTNGTFISARNISNLVNQMGYIAVLAVGMMLVIVARQIDLSVGFLAGFLGAVAAIAMTQWNLPVWVVIPMTLFLGICAGLLTGFMVARLKIPAFVASMAGWLAYRGLILLVTESTGTIIIPDATFNAIGNGFIPDFGGDAFLPGIHKVSLLLGVIAIVIFIYNEIRGRQKKMSYGFEVLPTSMFVMKLVVISALVGTITWILASYQGFSWTLVIVIVVAGIYDFVANKTIVGRHIYAVGGNPEAAELSGISVSRILYLVFGSMGMLSALSGILFASRLKSATTTAGNLFEMDAIAACYIGGVSAGGGIGKIMGAIIGALVMMSLQNGMQLMGTGISLQYVIRGLVLTAAVIFDVATRNRAK